MKKILWLSRHEMTSDQKCDLERIYGNIQIKKVDMTVNHGSQVVEAGEDCDILAIVLPINIQEQLLRLTNKPVISCKNNRVETGSLTSNGEKEYRFEFAYWFQIKEVKIVTEKL